MNKAELAELIRDVCGKVVEEKWQTIVSADAVGNVTRYGPPLLGAVIDETQPYSQAIQRVSASEQRGLRAGRLIRCLAAARGIPGLAAGHARKAFQDEAMAKALEAGDAVGGGFLVPPDYSSDIIELLRPVARVRAAGPTLLPMPVGTVSIPKVTSASTATYTGEGQNIPISQPGFGMVTLTWRKLTAMVPISNDLIRFATPNADAFVRDDLVRALALREDLAFLRGDGTQYTPKGFLHWAPAATNLLPANATISLTNVTIDLGSMLNVMDEANIQMVRPAWFMAPRTKTFLMTQRDGLGNFAWRTEMAAGTLMGFPFYTTTQIPTNLGVGSNESELYLAEMTMAVLGESERLLIDASTEAAYWDGTQLQSTYSRDQTAIRAIAEHDFAMRHDQAIVVLQAVKWGAP
jgi:HK97 family phage major capsid protein